MGKKSLSILTVNTYKIIQECALGGGVSADTRVGQVTISVKQEGNPVQHNSVAGVGSNV